jgi:carbon storage regulator
MLILTRRTGEAILIDGGVRVVVLAVDGNGVRLGIEAPSTVGIVREEVVQRITAENVRAGATEDAKQWLKDLGSQPREGDPPEGEAQEDPGEGEGNAT